jgi:hypothetical protein
MNRVCFRPSDAVRASVSSDGLILLDVQGGLVFASNAAGARIWTLLEARRSVAEIAAALVAEYRIDAERARRDVEAFVDALAARGVVVREAAC